MPRKKISPGATEKPAKRSAKKGKSEPLPNSKNKSLEKPKQRIRKTRVKIISEDLLVTKPYEFKNYFNSEPQLQKITAHSNPEDILIAYSRIIKVFASNHVRDAVEIEDLVSEAQRGVCEAIKQFNEPGRKRPNYNFHQACLYKIRTAAFQYCLRTANQMKTPYYVQRGCMHVGQIFKLMSNQSVAESILKRVGPATEEDIIGFLYNENERLPLKSKKFILQQITKKDKKEDIEQIMSGIMNHELGSRHSYIKNHLTDPGKILHIKEKLYFSSQSNNMKYDRVITLILLARNMKMELNPNLCLGHDNNQNIERELDKKELFRRGEDLCGHRDFSIFIDNKVLDQNYVEISKKYKLKKSEIHDVIKHCVEVLSQSEFFQEFSKEY